MIYKDITILDKNLHPLNQLGYGGRLKFELLEKIANYANTHDTKIVSVVRLVHPGEASAFGVDDIIKIGTTATGIIKWGIWKVYGDPHMKDNPRRSTKEIDKSIADTLKLISETKDAALLKKLKESYKYMDEQKDMMLKGNPRGRHRYLAWQKETERAAEEFAAKHDTEFQKKAQALRKIGAGGGALTPDDIKQVEKSWNIEWKDEKYISKNPRKKEMKMGIPDKKTSLFKIIEEIDETPNEYRFRMQPPSKFHENSLKYGKKPITKGVRAIYGCAKAEWTPRLEKCKKGMVMQSLRLSKDVFHSKTEAAGWIARHTRPRRE